MGLVVCVNTRPRRGAPSRANHNRARSASVVHRCQAAKPFLSSSVPYFKFNLPISSFDGFCAESCTHCCLDTIRELVLHEPHQKARLTHSSIAQQHELETPVGHLACTITDNKPTPSALSIGAVQSSHTNNATQPSRNNSTLRGQRD